MSPDPEPSSEERWSRPPDEECYLLDDVALTPPRGDAGLDRVIVRMRFEIVTDLMVEFALTQQTFHRGRWRNVAIADSSHDDEVHLHRYSRKTDNRVGPTEQLTPVLRQPDINTGYGLSYEQVVHRWVENKARWHDG